MAVRIVYVAVRTFFGFCLLASWFSGPCKLCRVNYHPTPLPEVKYIVVNAMTYNAVKFVGINMN